MAGTRVYIGANGEIKRSESVPRFHAQQRSFGVPFTYPDLLMAGVRPPPLLERFLRSPTLWIVTAITVVVAINNPAGLTRLLPSAPTWTPAARLIPPAARRAAYLDPSFPDLYSRLKPPHEELQRSAYAARSMWELGLQDELSGTETEFAMFGSFLGDTWNHEYHGYTRCANTAFAIATYLCGSAAAQFEHTALGAATVLEGVAQLKREIQAVRAYKLSNGDSPEAVFSVNFHNTAASTHGHVWILAMLPDGRLQHLQAFIDTITLASFVQKTPPYTPDEEKAFFDRLESLEAPTPTPFSLENGRTYSLLFGKRLKMQNVGAAGKRLVWSSLVCVVPAWNGTYADASTDEHQAAVAALVPYFVKDFSLASTFWPHDFAASLNSSLAAFLNPDEDDYGHAADPTTKKTNPAMPAAKKTSLVQKAAPMKANTEAESQD